MSDSVRPHRWQPTRLHHPWDFSGQEYWSGVPFPSATLNIQLSSSVLKCLFQLLLTYPHSNYRRKKYKNTVTCVKGTDQKLYTQLLLLCYGTDIRHITTLSFSQSGEMQYFHGKASAQIKILLMQKKTIYKATDSRHCYNLHIPLKYPFVNIFSCI